MSDIRIEALPGAYVNEDAYDRVLYYIANKSYIGGFGFSCNAELSIINQFRLSEEYSAAYIPDSRKIWHFILTFGTYHKPASLLPLAVNIARAFAPEYQILFGVDTGNPHLHFGVNAYSYHPDHPVLSEEKMQDYLILLQSYLQNHNPDSTVTLQFLGKGGQNV